MRITPARDPAYLAFVRERPCWFCSSTRDVQAHHHGRKDGGGGMGLKTCDYHTIPLCALHHAEWHRTGSIGARNRETTLIEMWRGVATTLRTWVVSELLPGRE